MEVYFGQLSWHLGYLLLALLSYAQGQSANATVVDVIFFESSINSTSVNSTLNLKDNFDFSFRTCSHGQLLWQQGRSGDTLDFSLTRNGALNISWTSANVTDSLLFFVDDSFRNNVFYTVTTDFQSGVIRIEIEGTGVVLLSSVLANSTLRQSLLALDLSGGSLLKLGEGYRGCIFSGTGINLDDAALSNVPGVRVNECLEADIAEDCGSGECASQPCLNNAECVEEDAGVSCLCPAEYTGEHCGSQIDWCSMVTCQNGGTCQNNGNNYTCSCLDTYAGTYCEEVISPYSACDASVCRNASQCVTTSTEPTCTCTSNSSCFDYQICHENTCQCPLGLQGPTCEDDVNYCANDTCLNGGTCKEGVATYTCMCMHEVVNLTRFTGDPRAVYTVGFDGVNCEDEIDECSRYQNICLNGGQCKSDTSYTHGFHCLCPQGNGNFFLGLYCQTKKDACQTLQEPDMPLCHNGGTCLPDGNHYTCDCEPGYSGPRCKIDIDECESSPCQNNGTCDDAIDGYSCNCSAGFTGTHCETDIDECGSNPCVNGVCQDQINGYMCNCTDTGYTGVLCQEDIDECASNPCQNDATCNDTIKGYTCSCHNGYQGTHCEIDINECESSPCQNSATCLQYSDQSRSNFTYETALGYYCSCAPGYEGVQCELDINECVSDPCLNGVCTNDIAAYVCQCYSGYYGTNCELEYDECELYRPCQHGASCMDKVADYACSCLPLFRGLPYGGKNCSVELTGCDDAACNNGGTCRPFLENETLGNHDYTCECLPGYAGSNCQQQTTASFLGNSWLRFEGTSGRASVNMQVTFRTSLPEGLILINVLNNDYMYVELVGGSMLHLGYSNVQDTFNLTIQTPDEVALNDGNWQEILIDIMYHRIDFVLINPRCPMGQCNVSSSFSSLGTHRHHDMGPTIYGGNDTDVSNIGIGPFAPFTGCLRDLTIALVSEEPVVIAPEEYINSSEAVNIQAGCMRQEQCSPDPCNGNGRCSDRWFSFACDCHRPYFGATCDENFIPATFGFESSRSHSIFTVPPSAANQLLTKAHVSLFFRTRAASGLLFYLGSADTTSENATYLVADIYDRRVRVWSKFGSDPLDSVTSMTVTDGKQHYLEVVRSNLGLDIVIDNMRTSFVIRGGDMLAEVVYFGSLPSPSGRRKRDLTQIGSFHGTLVDVRLDGVLMQFYAVNTTEELPPSFDPPVNTNVKLGEQSDQVCQLDNPCANNSTCSDVFFNDYSCNCTWGFRGKDCDLIDFCALDNGCPTDAKCQNVEDGFECASEATFDGAASQIQYSNSLNASNLDNTIIVDVRSRERDGMLLHLLSQDEDAFVTMEISNGGLHVLYDLGAADEVRSDQFDLLDGDYHKVMVSFSNDSVEILIDGSAVNVTTSEQTRTFGEMLQGSNTVYVGSVPSNYGNTHFFSANGMTAVKGCLGEVRVAGVLLPFFHQSQIVNSTASQKFYADAVTNLTTGCHGDPICDSNPCANSATCVDEWNAFSCACVPGYNGTLCEEDIDECEVNECTNGASCVDGINNYTCICAPGYTGFRCEVEEDECEFNPCQNGGACQDFVNYYNCTCLEGTLGGNCQYMVNETCDNDICENNSTCTPVNVTDISEPDYIETFNCTCLPGFTGVFCESEIDYCAGQPCKENSTCESSRDILDYICFCIPGFTDKNCSTNIDDCAPEPCENDATCEDLINDFICHCASGWEGKNCSIDKDECSLNNSLCENGFCENLPGSFICNCSGTGFEGPRCENDIDECEDSVCENGAECENFPGGYSCNCTLGYEGEHCSVANCSHDNCENGGTCLISNEIWACTCDEFYEGSRCEISGDCLNITCENGGTCYQSTDGTWANCTCIPGYDGVYCSNEIDECEGEPCLNGGTCTDLIAAFNCTCTDQYLGDTCQVYNNCSDDKFCLNDGVCNIGDDYAFICMCYGDYKGDRCEISPSPVNVGLIIGITIAALALVIVAIVGVAVVCHVRSKRATAGTYSPSRQEMDGSRVHMDQILKPPLEERLI